MFSQICSVVAVLLSLLRYVTYIRAIIRGTTKPHPLTWLGAGVMAGIAGVIQYIGYAGPTVWVTGLVAICCLAIGTAAIFVGERLITISDWISFGFALLIIPIWMMTKQPTIALLLVLLIELLNYYPTVRKSYSKPWEEDAVSWGLSALRWVFAAAAVTNVTLDTIAYPVFIAACEIVGLLCLLWRKRVLTAKL